MHQLVLKINKMSSLFVGLRFDGSSDFPSVSFKQTGCFLHHTDIQTLSSSIWGEVIQFWLYRPSLMTEGKLNCLSISPALPLPLCFSIGFVSYLSSTSQSETHPSVWSLCYFSSWFSLFVYYYLLLSPVYSENTVWLLYVRMLADDDRC